MKKEYITLKSLDFENRITKIYMIVFYRVAFDDDDALLRITQKRERNRGK